MAAELHSKARALDRGAALLSNLCVAHCVALPLLAVLVPAGLASGLPLSGAAHGPVWVHWLLLAVAAPVSAAALYAGVRLHRNATPAIVAAAGFAAMALGAMAHDGPGFLEPVLTVAGGFIVGVAHWINLRLGGRCKPRHASHS